MVWFILLWLPSVAFAAPEPFSQLMSQSGSAERACLSLLKETKKAAGSLRQCKHDATAQCLSSQTKLLATLKSIGKYKGDPAIFQARRWIVTQIPGLKDEKMLGDWISELHVSDLERQKKLEAISVEASRVPQSKPESYFVERVEEVMETASCGGVGFYKLLAAAVNSSLDFNLNESDRKKVADSVLGFVRLGAKTGGDFINYVCREQLVRLLNDRRFTHLDEAKIKRLAALEQRSKAFTDRQQAHQKVVQEIGKDEASRRQEFIRFFKDESAEVESMMTELLQII